MDITKEVFYFWTILEREIKLEIPHHVKNLLNVCGYNNALVFKQISDTDIDDVVEFARGNLLPLLQKIFESKKQTLDDETKSFFFGKFSTDPSHFSFSSTEIDQIRKCGMHVQYVTDFDGLNSNLEHFSPKNSNETTTEFTECAVIPYIGFLFAEKEFDGADDHKALRPEVQQTYFFLNRLKSTVDKNAERKKKGYRYEDDIKLFASYFRMLAGPLAYETIQRNLEGALPSLSATNRYILGSHGNIVEGVLRANELLSYLTERKLPLFVSLSEDATRITGRVEYDRKTNQLLGFVLPINPLNGMPVPYTYQARNANEIMNHFAGQNTVGHFVNVVMAKPLAPFPAFCLLMFVSDSKYSTETVSKRWNFIVETLYKINITVLVVSSDSDPRYNSAMKKNSLLGAEVSLFENKQWFSCDSKRPFYVQDTVHIATKLRNFFLKSRTNSERFPFGDKNFIKMQHLEYLLQNFPKDQHLLTASTLDPVDRQNFLSTQRLCDKRVIDLLKAEVKGSIATVSFLEILRDVTATFMDIDLTPLQRIDKIWYCVFIVRIWRTYVCSKKDLTLKDNFLTQNCYSCIELNAHSIVFIILYLKEHNLDHLFLPKFFDSQPCEHMFRQSRSFTSTYSTVTNCSIKEMLNRINKIKMQSDISLNPNFVFPRTGHKTISIDTTNIQLPSLDQICSKIEECEERSIKFAKKIKLIKINAAKKTYVCDVNPYKESKYANIEEEKKQRKPITVPSFKCLALKDFSERFKDETIPETSPFVEIATSRGKKMVIKITSLCWLLRRDAQKLSSDRLRRVQTSCRTNDSLLLPYFKGNKSKKLQKKRLLVN